MPAPHTVFDLIERDHVRHAALVEEVQAETTTLGRAQGALRIAADLDRHTAVEHSALVAVMLADPSVRALARRAVADHQRLHRLASDLTCRAYDEVGLAIALSTYRAAFLEHARFTQEELHPAAMHALGRERCENLAERYLAGV